MLDQYNATIDMLYSAAADWSRWPEALASIENLTGSVGAVIGFIPRNEGQSGFNLAGRFTDEQCAIYSATYQPICRRTQYMIAHPEVGTIHDSMIMSESEMDRDPVYDWFGQHDLRYFVGGCLPATQQFNIVWSLQRSPAQGHAQRAEIDLFSMLAPHVARSIKLADQLGSLRNFERFSSAILDGLPNALFALGPDGRLLFANAAANRILERSDGILLTDGQLRTRSASEQPQLDSLIRQALTPGMQESRCWTLASRAGGGLPYAIFVSPLNFRDDEYLSKSAMVLVAVHEVGGRCQPDAELIIHLYGLTQAEARVACALGGGHSVESAAALLGIRHSTARAHLKAIFRKVGVNRQQDLVAVLASISMAS